MNFNITRLPLTAAQSLGSICASRTARLLLAVSGLVRLYVIKKLRRHEGQDLVTNQTF